jgi:hypothetical protein
MDAWEDTFEHERQYPTKKHRSIFLRQA